MLPLLFVFYGQDSAKVLAGLLAAARIGYAPVHRRCCIAVSGIKFTLGKRHFVKTSLDFIPCRGTLGINTAKVSQMSTYLPKEVQDGLDAARLVGLRKSSRLRVRVGDEVYRVLRMWKDGFTVEEEITPKLRGLIDLYDGSIHLYQCLIVAAEAEAGEMRYDFKRSTAAADKAPLDFYRAPDAPVALLGHDAG